MLAGSVMTKRYEQKQRLAAPSKQTQSNPILRKKPIIIGFFSWYFWPNRIYLNVK